MRLEQPVQVHHEVANLRLVHALGLWMRPLFRQAIASAPLLEIASREG
jgi:hypothetical protein